MNNDVLKEQVRTYWNKESCGTDRTKEQKFSKKYFDEIEEWRYTYEPEIFSFAQFSRFYGKRVLEVGIGAGSDFIQWVRSGAHAYGIDLTQEAVDNVNNRLAVYDLKAAEVRVADAEHLPYESNSFDLVYSWGVIHHSPDTSKCLSEIVRVTKPGGRIKIMVYNRHSLSMLYKYITLGLLARKPFQSFSTILFNHQESVGTKAYTFKEVRDLLQQHSLKEIAIHAPLISYDFNPPPFRFRTIVRFLVHLFVPLVWNWERAGWFMMIEAQKLQE